MEFTHNLKILLLDSNSNIINDDFFLEEIKNILTNNNTHLLNWNGKKNSFTIKWNKINLNQLDRHFMGDLFSHPIYDLDSIILNHSQISLNISYFDLIDYLTENTNYLFSVVGVYKQNDIPTTYQINSFSPTPFLFNLPEGLIPISNLTSTLIAQTDIEISFTPPPDTSQLFNYIITISPPDNNNNYIFETSNTTYNISSLTANTLYDIRVRASYSFGDSLDTQISISTLNFIAITNLIVTLITTLEIYISFTPPIQLKNFNNYTITLSPPDSNNNSSFTTTDSTYTIANLASGNEYNISVVVNYTTGTSLPVDIDVFTSLLPGITNLKTSNISSSSITVSFTPPDNLTNVINYTLSLPTSSITFNNSFIILENLIPSTIYNIGVTVNYFIDNNYEYYIISSCL
jgi:hypothetical protein